VSSLYFLIPVALVLGITALVAFFWTIRSGQYEDPEGAKNRILDTDDKPLG
jgi:cbb3-type cytochrome oxidase maturation protein